MTLKRLSIIATLALFVSACGGDDDSPTRVVNKLDCSKKAGVDTVALENSLKTCDVKWAHKPSTANTCRDDHMKAACVPVIYTIDKQTGKIVDQRPLPELDIGTSTGN